MDLAIVSSTLTDHILLGYSQAVRQRTDLASSNLAIPIGIKGFNTFPSNTENTLPFTYTLSSTIHTL